jgi:hypothetical protein
MAKLPPIDLDAIWIKDDLHRGRRADALARIEAAIADGRAGPETIAIAERLRTAKRGRQPYGAKHLWWEIGVENDIMRDAGVSYAERLEKLALMFRLNDEAKLKTAIAEYEQAYDAIKRIDEESR